MLHTNYFFCEKFILIVDVDKDVLIWKSIESSFHVTFFGVFTDLAVLNVYKWNIYYVKCKYLVGYMLWL